MKHWNWLDLLDCIIFLSPKRVREIKQQVRSNNRRRNNNENASRQGPTPGIITECVAAVPLSTHFVWWGLFLLFYFPSLAFFEITRILCSQQWMESVFKSSDDILVKIIVGLVRVYFQWCIDWIHSNLWPSSQNGDQKNWAFFSLSRSLKEKQQLFTFSAVNPNVVSLWMPALNAVGSPNGIRLPLYTNRPQKLSSPSFFILEKYI